MGAHDYYSKGNWNFYCDLCGKKNKSKNAMKAWDGHYVCKHHKEVRNPQDFQKGVIDNQTVPWSRIDNAEPAYVPIPLPNPADIQG